MCGICGFTGPANHEVLIAMRDTLLHRGPDDHGEFENSEISLAMRRLSIVDIEYGKQPVFIEDKSIVVVFNGEIFNHLELRKELQQLGHKFQTHHSDTEVLVHAYEQYGVAMLDKLDGMFAFSIWDSRKKQLFVARDHAGIKPLYYTILNNELVFASEIKSILRHPRYVKRPDFGAIYHYFTFKNIPSPSSAFAEIHQLRPGEYLIFRDHKIETHRWWRLRYKENIAITLDEAKLELARLLDRSVQLRMQSDAPFGAYLSGGLDSSLVVALMAKHSSKPVKTFSLVYRDQFANKTEDQRFARMMSERLNTEHHEHVIEFSDVVAAIEQTIHAFDEPFSGVTSTYFLTQLIQKHVKVALSGDGADELFGSYLPHRLAQPIANYLRLKQQYGTIPDQFHNELKPYDDQLDELQRLGDMPTESMRRMQQYVFSNNDKLELLSPQFRAHLGQNFLDSCSQVQAWYDASMTDDPLNRALFLDFNTLLPDQVLAFVDRLSMANSVEVRPPFLDRAIIEFSASIPGSMKITQGQTKHILKQAAEGLLPDELIHRPKEGFVLPVNEWLARNNDTWVRDILSSRAVDSAGILNSRYVNRLVDRFYTGDKSVGSRLWNLIQFQLWWNRHF